MWYVNVSTWQRRTIHTWQNADLQTATECLLVTSETIYVRYGRSYRCDNIIKFCGCNTCRGVINRAIGMASLSPYSKLIWQTRVISAQMRYGWYSQPAQNNCPACDTDQHTLKVQSQTFSHKSRIAMDYGSLLFRSRPNNNQDMSVPCSQLSCLNLEALHQYVDHARKHLMSKIKIPH